MSRTSPSPLPATSPASTTGTPARSAAPAPPATSPTLGRRQLVTVERAAEYADCAPRTIRRYISAGLLTGYRMGPRLVRIDMAELDAMLRPIPAAGGDQVAR